MPKAYIPRNLRQQVIDRAGGCCEYCLSQVRFSSAAFAVEHIKPSHAGGPSIESNLALSCQGCNSHKAIKTTASDPLTDLPASLFNPRKENWNDHFIWSADYAKVHGISPAGRATVAALRLNRPGLVNMRRVLYAMGEHPPVGFEVRQANE